MVTTLDEDPPPLDAHARTRPLRVLQVSSFMPPHPGGLELVVHNLVDGLRERGHALRWIASATPQPAGVDDHLVRVPAFTALERLAHVPLPFWGAVGHARLWAACRWAEIVHVHDCLYPSSGAAIAVARMMGKPVVMTQHIARVPYGPMLDRVQALAYRSLGRALLDSVDEVIVYSPHVADFVAKLGVRTPVRRIPLGFDPRFRPPTPEERRAARAAFALDEHTPVALFVGRLVPKKGVHQLAALAPVLVERGVALMVVGEGPLAPLVAALPHARHLPSVPYAAMHTLFAAADVLVLPSSGEGFPLAVQEALLTGLPAVVSEDPAYLTNLAGAPGVWHGSSVDALAHGVACALEAPPAREEIARWAGARFRRDAFITAYENVYLAHCAAVSAA